MDLCLAKKKNGEICNKPTKYIIKLENEKEYIHPRCGMHLKNIDDTNKIKLDEFYQKNKKNDNNTIDLDDVANNFNEKINITNDKNNEKNNNKKIDKKEIKKPCLQYIIYLISKDDNDMCQFEDCQFAHNIEIIYT
jgi:flagellar hook-associated protein FlgK